MAQGIKERFDSPEEEQRLAGENVAANLRVAIPGIIDSFNPATQTATVQPAIIFTSPINMKKKRPKRSGWISERSRRHVTDRLDRQANRRCGEKRR